MSVKKKRLKCVMRGNMWSRKVPSNQDVSSDSSATELKTTIQTITFLENQLHNTCVIQLHSIQVSITEVLAQYNHDNVNDYVDDDDDNNNTELKQWKMAIPKGHCCNCCKFLSLCVTKLHYFAFTFHVLETKKIQF